MRNSVDISEIKPEGEEEHTAISVERVGGLQCSKHCIIAVHNAYKTRQTRYKFDKN